MNFMEELCIETIESTDSQSGKVMTNKREKREKTFRIFVIITTTHHIQTTS